MPADRRPFLTSLFNAAVEAADPIKILAPHMPAPPKGKTVVVGAGKGAAQLAHAFEAQWNAPLTGLVVTRYGYATPCDRITVLEAAHPVPDEAGILASEALLSAVSGLSADDLVIALICGGGSALLPAPPEGLTLQDERDLNQALLASGAPIGVMNAIRKHVSRIKGGRLAQAAFPAKVLTLVVSDVPGDNPAEVASGPTVPSGVTLEDTIALVQAWDIALPDRIQAFLANAADAPKPGDAEFQHNEVRVVASARLSLEAAADMAEKAGFPSIILSDAIEGEARDVGLVHAAIAREVATRGRPFKPPVLLLSGGETTVTLKNPNGRGGRNTEFLLSFAQAIAGVGRISALAADTDGIDGSQQNAGAFADETSAARMRAAGIDPRHALSANDAWRAFSALGDLFEPGPTGTNVNDFRAILIEYDHAPFVLDN